MKATKELPFPRSTVERLIRANTTPEQVASGRVKIAMNGWLGELAVEVVRDMARSPNKTLTGDDFKRAVHKYELADKLTDEKVRISRRIEETNKQISQVIQDFEKSIVKKEDEASVRIVHVHDTAKPGEEAP